ncbi:uncharacterized protein LOC121399347 isoform X2 [Xenopus laevis]|uniref:Uncharacterized protein LOC121399347 isoform X2 n=1 Tax=Xenopus laevis TaxID=8355 RepID=A0A8J1M234_XENLA|nr:uncharacterized protein LOC121399347 isoform X2 [Xenopus laevis]
MRTDQKILIRKKGAEQVKASCAVFYIPQQLADTKRVKASLLYFRIPQELQESKDTVYLGCRGKIQRPWNVWNLLHHLIFHSQEKESPIFHHGGKRHWTKEIRRGGRKTWRWLRRKKMEERETPKGLMSCFMQCISIETNIVQVSSLPLKIYKGGKDTKVTLWKTQWFQYL